MLKTLRSIIQAVTKTRDFKDALEMMVHRVAKALNTQACSIFLLNQKEGYYLLVATKGLNPDAVGKVRIPINQGLIGLIGEREEPINIDDASKHPRFLQVIEVKEEQYKAFLGTPLIYHRKVLGVLIVQQHQPRRYDESEEAFLVTLAAQLAAIIAHAEAIGESALLFDAHQTKHEAIFKGIPSVPGIGIGTGVVIYPALDFDSIPDRAVEDVDYEIHAIEMALASGQEDFRLLSERLYTNLPLEERSLFDVYQRMLDTTDLGAEIIQLIREGNWAQGALRQVIQKLVNDLENHENEYLHDRAVDVKDLGYRVLCYLQKNKRTVPLYSKRTILISETLTASDLAEVPEGCLAGLISSSGSSNSHVAILARAMNIPTVMGVKDIPIYELAEKEIIVDGYEGQVYVSPDATLRKEFERLASEESQLDVSLESLHDIPGQTKDGHRVVLMVNTGLGADISLSLAAGAEGVGLYRTEAPFLMRDRFPSGEEQRVIYRQLLTSFAPLPVTMRTLDIGGDKALPYFPVQEENPFLGWRGIRITLDHPDLFLVQVRAMMRASDGLNNLRIMLPMIADVSEVDDALVLINKSYKEVLEEGIEISMPKIGVLIEVPSAVYQARMIAKRVDFLSVGSNDLTQYLLAVDRNNTRVANLFDSLHPAVLKALIEVVNAAHEADKPISICGEMAGDPVAVLLLVGMGFNELSMGASAIPRIKWIINQFTLPQACQLLQKALEMEGAAQIRSFMEMKLEEKGGGGLFKHK